MHDHPDPPTSPGEGILDSRLAPLTFGLVALITVIAFESQAVSTAMPEVAVDLDAVRSYGLAFSVMLTTQLLGIVLAGVWCDRSGTIPSLVGGQALFAAGCALCGAATTFGPFLLGRAIAGLGAGLTIVAAYVVIGHTYPESLRPRVFSALSAAWVLPSLLGPLFAAWLTDNFSWRWVFWAVLVPVAVALVVVISRRSMIDAADAATLGTARDHNAHRRAAWCGLALSVAAGALQWGTHEPHLELSAKTVVGLAGLVGVVTTAPMLLPAGTFALRRGVPCVMAARFLMPCAFFATVAYVPLMLTGERGLSLQQAGLILAIGSLGWSLGSWIQGRDVFAGRRARLVSLGSACLSLGLVGVAGVTWAGWWPWLMTAPLAVGGVGMGLGMSSTSVLALELTTPAEHGGASSSLQLADVLGAVCGISATGTFFAALHTQAGQDVPVFVAMWVGTATVAAIGVIAGRRIVKQST